MDILPVNPPLGVARPPRLSLILFYHLFFSRSHLLPPLLLTAGRCRSLHHGPSPAPSHLWIALFVLRPGSRRREAQRVTLLLLYGSKLHPVFLFLFYNSQLTVAPHTHTHSHMHIHTHTLQQLNSLPPRWPLQQ